MSDTFNKWYEDQWNGLKYYQHTTEHMMEAYAAGRAQAERDIMARWPSITEYENFYIRSGGEMAYSEYIYSKLFPNDKRDEVK